ncbi:hypothetical protein EVAR_49036_1 [Eumeta japonica]|uniref:Uncharacterized protein n=1 Tax=Eumeta variegata TaxID=151549 RepID=A0A4C1XMR7_EUMVA|nr:hypothetical protein EVAR_49036_1 [Eumeta japonica]
MCPTISSYGTAKRRRSVCYGFIRIGTTAGGSVAIERAERGPGLESGLEPRLRTGSRSKLSLRLRRSGVRVGDEDSEGGGRGRCGVRGRSRAKAKVRESIDNPTVTT